MNDPQASLVDPSRTTSLYDVGAPGYEIAVAVAPDGGEQMLLVEIARLDDATATFDPGCRSAPHEQPGPLPTAWRNAVWAHPVHRCGRPTQAGARCRIHVQRRGDACAWHRSQTVRKESL